MKVKEESPLQAQGYEHYLSLGANRSLEAVAQLMGRSLRTVQGWAKTWEWEGRYQQHTQIYGEDVKEPQETEITVNGEPTKINVSEGPLAPQEILDRFPLIAGRAGAMTKHEYRSVLGSLVRDFVDKFRAGDISIRNISDLEKIVKLDLLLMGEATQRTDITATNEHLVRVEAIVENNPLAKDLIRTMWRNYTNPPQDIKERLTQGLEKLAGTSADMIIIDDPLNNVYSERIVPLPKTNLKAPALSTVPLDQVLPEEY